jgi:hypothetical protein
LKPSERAYWESVAGSQNTPAVQFNLDYESYKRGSRNGLLTQFLNAVQSSNGALAGKSMFMMALFADPLTHQLIFYFPAETPLPINYGQDPAPYAMANGALTLDRFNFGVRVVNGALSIISAQGAAVTPFAIPSAFIERAMQ